MKPRPFRVCLIAAWVAWSAGMVGGLTARSVMAQPALESPAGSVTPPSGGGPLGPPPQAGGGGAFDRSAAAVGGIASRNLVLDLAVPESPAFEVLGFTPERVSRPTSPRQFAANLLNGVDESGNLQTGLALDTSPYLLFGGGDVTLTTYQRDYLTRLLTRTQLSLGTTKGSSSDDESVRVGLGIKTTLWDEGDPRGDPQFMACLGDAHRLVHDALGDLLFQDPVLLAKVNGLLTPPGGDPAAMQFVDVVIAMWQQAKKEAVPPVASADAATAAKVSEILRAKLMSKLGTGGPDVRGYVDRIVAFLDLSSGLQRGQLATTKCFDEAKLRNWNQPAWDVGGAASWISPDGEFGSLGDSGGAAWTSLSLNLPDETWWGLGDTPRPSETQAERSASSFVRDHFQLILHARYRGGQEVPDPSGSGTIDQDTALAGGRLRMGTPRWALSVEGAYTDTRLAGKGWDPSAFYSVGGEVRVADDLWFQVSVGSQAGNDTGDDQTSVLGSIKYGFSSGTPFETWQAVASR